jgi:1,4-alpha-glucan branching enzyme
MSTPWGSAVNLDGRGSDEVRRFFCDSAISWMRDYHIDGLRLDAVHAIMDISPLNILEQLAAETADLARQTQRRLVLIAEDDLNDPRVVTCVWRITDLCRRSAIRHTHVNPGSATRRRWDRSTIEHAYHAS